LRLISQPVSLISLLNVVFIGLWKNPTCMLLWSVGFLSCDLSDASCLSSLSMGRMFVLAQDLFCMVREELGMEYG